mgnify:CR=1 FL=1
MAIATPADIELLYRTVLGREPEPEGFQYWTGQNLPLEELVPAFVSAATPEFDIRAEFPIGTSPEETIKSTYQLVLGREPEPEGFQYWMGVAGGLSPEELSDAIIQAAYQELVGRASGAFPQPTEQPTTDSSKLPTDYMSGVQRVMTLPEQMAFQTLQGLGKYEPPAWATDVLKGIAEHPETEQERFAFGEAQRFFGPLGQSPYTIEALKAWEKLTKPTIEQAMAIQGTYAPSGAYAETLSRARTEATVPLIQQDLQSRLAMLPFIAGMGESQSQRRLQASGMGSEAALSAAQLQALAASQLSGMGTTLADRYRTSLLDALAIAGMPREFAQQQISSSWGALDPIMQAYQSLYFGPFAGVISQPGSVTTTSGGSGWGIGK